MLFCPVAGRTQVHKFVVADIVESVLIGLDFMRLHRANWDWLKGGLVFREEGDQS